MRFRAGLPVALVLVLAASAADFDAGLKAYERGDYVRARSEWQPIAEQGGAAAQFNLGLLYYDGHGVPQNYAEARRWFERAANQGYAKAQHNLGAMYGAGKGVNRDYAEAYKWLSICAAQGEQSCAGQRDLVAKKLKKGQLDTAQKLALEWRPVPEQRK